MRGGPLVPQTAQSQLQGRLGGGRYVLWFVPGSWWAVPLDAEAPVVFPDGPPDLEPQCPN